MAREKTVKIDLRISERDEKRLKAIMAMGDWNRSEALRFVLNLSYIILEMLPSAVFETFIDDVGESVGMEPPVID